MLQQNVIYLINAEIDGELEPAESAELESILATSAEARAMKAELRKLTKLMEDMPEVEPPADLAGRILGQIGASAPRPAARSSLRQKWSLPGSLPEWLVSFQPAQTGVAFAAGLLLTVAFYESAQYDAAPADLSSMVGTMVADPSSVPTREKASLPITGPGLSGSVSLGVIGEYVVLSFDLESAQQTEIEVGLAEAGLGFGGIVHASVAGNALDETYEVSGGALRMVNQGRQVFSVFLPQVADPTADRATGQDGGGREISIGISAQGAPVFSGVLRG